MPIDSLAHKRKTPTTEVMRAFFNQQSIDLFNFELEINLSPFSKNYTPYCKSPAAKTETVSAPPATVEYTTPTNITPAVKSPSAS